MSSSSAITTSSGDFETISIVTHKANGGYNRATIERAIVQDLAVESSVPVGFVGTTLSDKIATYDTTTAGKINTSDLSHSNRKQFEISTTTTNGGRYSLLSEYLTGDVSSASSFSSNVAGNSKTTSIVQSTTSWADSCLKIDITGNYGPFDDLSNAEGNAGANFTATFDSAGTNVDDIKAVNSQYSTTDNSRPLQIVEADFNSSALGVDQSNWYAEDTTGNPVATALSTYSLASNDYLTSMTNSYASFNSSVNTNRFGTFKFEREAQKPLITINADATGTNSSSNLPFESLPANTLTEAQFLSIFNTSGNVIAPGYKFDINSQDSGANSGFGFGSVSTKTHDDTSITLDDSGLKNNATYMTSWVTKPHSLEIAKPTFDISALDNDNTGNVSGFSLSSGAETLSAVNNGQIKINKSSTDDRISYVTPLTNAVVNVYYEGEDNTKTHIVDDDKTNSYIKYSSRKVWEQPLSSKYVGSSAGSFKTSGNAALNLYGSSSIVNTSFNTNKFDFNFTSGDTEVAAFKVTGTKPLTEINGLLKKSDNTVVSGMSISSVLNNFNGVISANKFFSNAKINLTLKPVTALSFYDVIPSSDWTVSGSNCYTSSYFAFNENPKIWPKYDDVLSVLVNNYNIDVTMSVRTGVIGGIYELQDYVTITYKVNDGQNVINTIKIAQADVTTGAQTVVSDISSDISSSLFTINTNSPLVSRNIKLEKHIVTRTYRLTIPLDIRPYTNLSSTTPVIKSVTTMYKIKDMSTNQYYSSMYLKYITMKDNSSLSSTEALSPNVPAQSLDYSFVIQPNDLKSLNAIIVDVDANNISTDLTLSTPLEPFFGTENILELKSQFESSPKLGDVKIIMNCEYLDTLNKQTLVEFKNEQWYIPLIPDYAVEYTVTNFNSSYADLATNTDIDNDTEILSVDNGFNKITTWNDDYKVVVTYNSGVTTLSVQNKIAPIVEKFNIKLTGDSSLVATAIVSYSLYDAYRCVKQIGNVAPYTSSTSFMSVDQAGSQYMLSSGVYVKTVTGLLSSVANGAEIAFTLKGDNCGVNMVGSVSSLSELTYASGLSFQYTSGTQYSRTLTLPFYRGYKGVQSVNQVYTINRGLLNVVFTIADSVNGNFVQTISGVYAGLSGVAINGLSQGVGDIGLKLSFGYSLLDDSVYTSDNLSVPIVNVGDTVTFSIVNPNGTSQTAPSSTSLKTHVLYTFNGSNFNGTNSPLAIRSYRLKVKSSEFSTLETGAWSLELVDADVKVYYSSTYLGNPTGLTYGTDPIATAAISTVMKGAGITINGWNIKISSTASSTSAISYWSMLPPYLKFSQTVYASSIALPYTPGVPATQVSYEPVSDTNTYNPFSSTTELSNIEYKDLRSKSVSAYKTAANTTPYKICVEGNTYTISYCLGLQSGTNVPVSVLANPLFSGAANRLLNIVSGSSVIFWTNSSSSNNSVVKMNFLQPTISQIYTHSELTGETDVAPNILVQFGTFFYSAGTQYLNLPTGDGVKTYVYTHAVEKLESNSNDIYADYKFTLYKYIPVNLSDWNNQPPSKQITLGYSTRYYFEHTVSIPLGTGTTVKNYFEEIRGSISSMNISWTADTTYNNSNTTDYLTVKFLSQNSKTEIPALLWTVSTTNNNSKGVIVNQAPLYNILDKMGYSSMTIYNNGVVNTSGLSLTPA